MTKEKAGELQDSSEGLAEAPASASVKVKSKNGFEYIFTMRDQKAHNLMFKIDAMETKWLGLGWTPIAQGTGFKGGSPMAPQFPTKPCTVHNVEMKGKPSKTPSGQPYWSHATGVYGTPGFDVCYGQGFKKAQQTPVQNQEYPERDIQDF